MNRRKFIGTAMAAGLSGPFIHGDLLASEGKASPSCTGIAGSPASREILLADCRHQLFNQYLPFWENGGIDKENGGFICYLHEDGRVENDRKDIWYQGRGIWVYSYLYNEIDRNPKWLARAKEARDFMVRHMHRGDGTWLDTVNRHGKPVDGIAIDREKNIYGALFAALGLIQFYKANGSAEDLELAKLSLRKSVQRYEDPDYPGVVASGVEETGLRTQGCSFMMVWVIPQLLAIEPDPWLEAVLEEHLDCLENKFWNPDYGISNEILFHDYSRILTESTRMIPGHSIEAQWMCMEEAFRNGDLKRYHKFKCRMRRLIEMSWDYPFGGTCDTEYNVFPVKDLPAGQVLDIKTMWAQTEVSIGCLLAYERTREEWSREWFERSWEYLQRTMTTDHGVWRQAVGRQGNDKQRAGISIYRRGNFHQPRCLMYMICSLQRLNAGGSIPAVPQTLS